MSLKVVAVGWLCALCLLFVEPLRAQPQQAQPQVRVVLLQSAEVSGVAKEAVTRTDAELRSAGFAVVYSRRGTEPDVRLALARAAEAQQAVAAISLRLAAGGASAEVWVVDQLTDKTVLRRIDVSAVAPSRRAFSLALRTVELLRASLLELADPAASQEDPVSAEVPAAVAELLDRAPAPPLDGFAIELGVGALFSLDGLQPAVAPQLRLSYGGEQGLALRLGWLPPVMNNSHDGPLGIANVRQQLIALEGVYVPGLNGAPIVPLAAAGVGVFHLAAEGELRAPAVGTDADVWSLAVLAGGGAMARIDDHFAATLQLQGVLALPRARVTIRGESLGSAGRPSLLLSLGGVGRF